MDDVRTEIDRIDRQVIALIGERAGYVDAAAQLKRSETEVRAPDRVRTMLYQRRAWAQEEGLDPSLVEKLYHDMVQFFIYEEMTRWNRTAPRRPAAPPQEAGVIIKQVAPDDLTQILTLQRLAYQSEAERYNDPSIPPLTQTLDEIRAEFEDQVFVKAVLEERIVGSVRAHMVDGTCTIGRLIVHPDYQNRGIGTALMAHIEGLFGHVRRFELFTGDRSEPALHLYRKLGYRPFREQALDTHTLVFLEKPTAAG
jgi:chorismate mutase-like protein